MTHTTEPTIDEVKKRIHFGFNNNHLVETTDEAELLDVIQQLISDQVAKARIELLDSLYYMYVQYCGGKNGHMFMGAGEIASEILEDAGYIVVDNIGSVIKDNGDSQEQDLNGVKNK